MESQPVQLIIDDALAIVRLDHHETRNALSQSMIQHIGTTLKSCENRNIRAVYITGTGPAFCSGADVKAFQVSCRGNPFHVPGLGCVCVRLLVSLIVCLSRMLYRSLYGI